MSGRILVVDDIEANVRLLEARLMAEYFQVLTASNGRDALEICANGECDVVLLDVMMPEMDGFEVCRRLKADPRTMHLPVVMVTALDQVEDRVQGLNAGADDFLTKPVNDLALVTRVKSLVRLKMLTDELRLRASTTRNIGIEELLSRRDSSVDGLPRVLIVDERQSAGDRIAQLLRGVAHVEACADPQTGVFRAAEEDFECVFVSTGFSDYDPLRLCSQLRSIDRTRFIPIILLADAQTKGARILTGGRRLIPRMQFFMPTIVVDVTTDMRIMREESFGPLMPIMPFADEDEAVRLANDSDFGLLAYVFSRDHDRAKKIAERVEAGTVMINEVLMSHAFPETPWGGVKQSGIGFVHSDDGLRALCHAAHVNYDALPMPNPVPYPYDSRKLKMLFKGLSWMNLSLVCREKARKMGQRVFSPKQIAGKRDHSHFGRR